MDGKVKRRINMAKKNIKYDCKTCGVEVETRVIGEGFAYWSRQCPYCYSQSLMAKTDPEKPNARLIATAPEMLKALKQASEYCDLREVGEGGLSVQDIVDNAIAKAEGAK
jgi:DNA-directed RNA polymerase subunit RPC12/RpoP